MNFPIKIFLFLSNRIIMPLSQVNDFFLSQRPTQKNEREKERKLLMTLSPNKTLKNGNSEIYYQSVLTQFDVVTCVKEHTS